MPKYAQIDVTTGKCIGVSFLSGEVEAEHMILLGESDNVNPRDTYDKVAGTWTPAPPEPLQPQGPTIKDVQDETVSLNLQIIDLYETLITKGVL